MGLFRIESDQPFDSLLTYRTKLRMLVGAHPAIRIGAIDAFQRIAGTFMESGTLHAFPLTVKIFQCCDVGFPRLNVSRIHRNLLLFVGIFVSKASKGMSELMNHHGLERRMVSHAQVVAVEYASAAIVVRIDQNNDMLVGSSCKPIV